MTGETRFRFGRNWQSFRKDALDEARIAEAVRGLEMLVGKERIKGKTFLDIGSGSGLHSLAAHRLGAAHIVSFDYDQDSVDCTRELRRESGAADWTVTQGSVLDEPFVRSLGTFDVVYSWGVLHHTGDMWRAIDLATIPVRENGHLSIAIYNKVKGKLGVLSSESWAKIKRTYSAGSERRQRAMLAAYVAWQLAGSAMSPRLVRSILDYRSERGMSWMHDARDWLGGYPYEFATEDELVSFVGERGFRVLRTIPVVGNGWGNHQLLFERI